MRCLLQQPAEPTVEKTYLIQIGNSLFSKVQESQILPTPKMKNSQTVQLMSFSLNSFTGSVHLKVFCSCLMRYREGRKSLTAKIL